MKEGVLYKKLTLWFCFGGMGLGGFKAAREYREVLLSVRSYP